MRKYEKYETAKYNGNRFVIFVLSHIVAISPQHPGDAMNGRHLVQAAIVVALSVFVAACGGDTTSTPTPTDNGQSSLCQGLSKEDCAAQLADADAGDDTSADTNTEVAPDPCALCTSDQQCDDGVCVDLQDPCQDFPWLVPGEYLCGGIQECTLTLTPEGGYCVALCYPAFRRNAEELTPNEEEGTFDFEIPGTGTFTCTPQ